MTGTVADGSAEKLIATDDLDVVRDLLSSIYVPHEVRMRGTDPLDLRLRYVESPELTLGHLRYGADFEAVAPPWQDCYHLTIALRGVTESRQSGVAVESVAGEVGTLFGPDAPAGTRWSPDAVQYVLKLPRASLEGQLAALTGRPRARPIDFDLRVDLTTPRGQSLVAAIGHLRSELSRAGGIGTAPLVRAQLESYVLSHVLLTATHESNAVLTERARPVSRRHVRAALDFIEDHIADPLTGPVIAGAANVSLRALQAGFVDELGTSPMAYVRHRRLELAHRDLADGSASVKEVASAHGFAHLGRFADSYRRRFGTLPSETADRARRMLRDEALDREST